MSVTIDMNKLENLFVNDDSEAPSYMGRGEMGVFTSGDRGEREQRER